MPSTVAAWAVGLGVAAKGVAGAPPRAAAEPAGHAPAVAAPQVKQAARVDAWSAAQTRATLQRYCLTCHNARLQTAGLDLDAMDAERVGAHPAAIVTDADPLQSRPLDHHLDPRSPRIGRIL